VALNLTPDLSIIALQAVVFSANFCVVKTFFVTPYLQLREKKRAATEEREQQALRSQQESLEGLLKIEVELRAEQQKLTQWMESEKQGALQLEREAVEEAKRKASETTEAFRRELQARLVSQRQGLSAWVVSLSEQCVTTVLKG
jgi:F0F1-type ATP synthase membrane subunit b/b'